MLEPHDVEILAAVAEVLRGELQEMQHALTALELRFELKIAALEAREPEVTAKTFGDLRGTFADLEGRFKTLEERPLPKDGKDGVSPELPDYTPLISEKVADILGQWPRPKDGEPGEPGKNGKGVTVEDFLPLFEAEYAKFELSVERRIMDAAQRAIDRMPVPKNGENGKDGFGFDEFEVITHDERTIEFRFVRGDQVKSAVLKAATPLHQGVWKTDQSYVKGDGVTWDGSWWIAQRDAPGKPSERDSGWRLAVKCGRDGKDGKGVKGDPGPPGKNGRDLTQLAPNGQRY